MNNSGIEIFKADDGQTQIQVKLDNETVWLNQYQLEELFQTDRTSITRHISTIYRSKELEKNATCAKIAQVQKEGNRELIRKIKHYNLDIIIAVRSWVNSKRETQFRIWANRILKEYLIQGYSINEKRLLLQNEKLNLINQEN